MSETAIAAHRKGGETAAVVNAEAAREFYAPILPIVAELRDQGLSLRAIAAELDRRGITPRTGYADQRWSATQVQRLLARLDAGEGATQPGTPADELTAAEGVENVAPKKAEPADRDDGAAPVENHQAEPDAEQIAKEAEQIAKGLRDGLGELVQAIKAEARTETEPDAGLVDDGAMLPRLDLTLQDARRMADGGICFVVSFVVPGDPEAAAGFAQEFKDAVAGLCREDPEYRQAMARRQELAEVQKRVEAMAARLVTLRAQRREVELSGAGPIGARLVDLDAQIAEADRARQEAEGQAAVLAPIAQNAQAVISRINYDSALAMRRHFHERLGAVSNGALTNAGRHPLFREAVALLVQSQEGCWAAGDSGPQYGMPSALL